MPNLIILLLVAAGLWAIARTARDRTLSPRLATLAAAVLVAGIAVGSNSGLTTAADTLEATPNPTGVVSTKGPDRNVTPGLDEFLAWASVRIPQDAKFLVVCAADPCDPTLRLWITTRLAPRQPVQRYRSTDWLVFQGAEQADTPYRAFPLRDVQGFAAGQLIARPGPRG